MDIIFEDNHLLVVNKRAGDLVQPDPSGTPGLEQEAKAYLKEKYNKKGDVFLGVVHRIDRPVSGVVVLAKTSKALVRLNEQLRDGGFEKTYLAIVENCPPKEHDTLRHYIWRNEKTNKSYASTQEKKNSKEALLEYNLLGASDRYFLLSIKLLTGRHHQIRAQLSALGSPIKGDLKYGARRSNIDGSISLHSHTLTLTHPVSKERITFTAPRPTSNPWGAFADNRT
ncbi:MAG: RNA pseudouridine synthase [Mucinivorans sp.]